jgi:hypothetical protein
MHNKVIDISLRHIILTIESLFRKSSIPTSSNTMSLKLSTTIRLTLPLETSENLDHQLAPVFDTKTGEEPTEMRTNRWHRHTESAGDLFVGMTEEELLNNLRLTWRQTQIRL